MNVIDAIKGRRSVRAFKRKEIEKEKIELLKEAIIWAPSAGNLQSRKFYFVFNKKLKEEIVLAALDQEFIAQAPLVIIACADSRIEQRYGRRGTELYNKLDVAASVQNLMLEAFSLGLGTCWVAAFSEEKIKGILDLPKNLTPLTIIPVGYQAEKPSAPKRKSLKELIEEIK
ncbi:MAG: nitroreductase family protein [Candidatus Diapherotrites archaeon]